YGRSSKHWLSAVLSSLVPDLKANSPIAVRLSATWGTWGTSGGIYTPFVGAWLAYTGMRPIEIGALLSSGMLLRVIVPPITGILADARHARRSMIGALMGVQLVCWSALNWFLTPLALFVLVVTSNMAGGAAGPLGGGGRLAAARRSGL